MTKLQINKIHAIPTRLDLPCQRARKRSNTEWGPRNNLSCMKIGKKTEEKRISREIY